MLGGAAAPPRPAQEYPPRFYRVVFTAECAHVFFSRHLGDPGKVLEEVWCVWMESWTLLTPFWRPWGAWGTFWGGLGELFGVLGAPGGGPGRGLGGSWKALDGLGR